jgi:hypothetical protein
MTPLSNRTRAVRSNGCGVRRRRVCGTVESSLLMLLMFMPDSNRLMMMRPG